MGLFKKKAKSVSSEDTQPVLAAVIQNTVLSEIYQDILKQNGIKFICRQQGAGGYLKLILGDFVIPDYIYVNSKNYELACELYKTYIETQEVIEIPDSEEN